MSLTLGIAAGVARAQPEVDDRAPFGLLVRQSATKGFEVGVAQGGSAQAVDRRSEARLLAAGRQRADLGGERRRVAALEHRHGPPATQ